MLTGKGTAQGGAVAHNTVHTVHLCQFPGKGGGGILILVGIEQNHGIGLGEDIRNGVFHIQRVGGADLTLEQIAAQEQKERHRHHGLTEFEAEAGQPVQGDIGFLFEGLVDQAFAHQDQTGENGQHADHTQQYALGKHHADVKTDLEVHKYQHDQTHDSGQTAAADGSECLLPGVGHSQHPVLRQQKLLPVAVHHNDGVVHGQHHLQDRRNGEGGHGDTAQENIGAHIQDYSDPQGCQEQERFCPGRTHGAQDTQTQYQRHRHDPEGQLAGIGTVIFYRDIKIGKGIQH